jgi:hypothetical protein
MLVAENLLAVAVLVPRHGTGPRTLQDDPAAGAVPDAPAAAMGTGRAVTAFVQWVLAPRVMVVEGALAAANQLVPDYHAEALEPRALGASLLSRAWRLQAIAEELDSVPLPMVPADVRVLLRGLVEDLVLVSQQLSTLFQETAAAVTRKGMNGPIGWDGAVSVGYDLRVQSAEALMRRAQGWLQTIDQETGAQVRLTGFARGQFLLQA